MANENGAIGWDDEVSENDAGNRAAGEDALVTLPPGEYPFTVNKVERGSFKGSEKLPPCNMVKVGIILDGGDEGHGYSTKRFYMHTKCLYQIYDFLTAIGLHKKGDGATTIPWGKVEKGLTGTCKVKIHTYNGKDSNEVEKWLAPTAPAAVADDEEMPY